MSHYDFIEEFGVTELPEFARPAPSITGPNPIRRR
jgi:hypothetical protein